MVIVLFYFYVLCETEVESRTQDSRPRPRTQKKIRGQRQPFRGQTLLRPRPRTKDTSGSALQNKRSSQKFFRRSPKKKKGLHKNFSCDLHKILTIQKIVLSSSRGQANFRGLEASRPRPRTWPSRPRSRPRTLKCVLEDSTSDVKLKFYAWKA